MTSSTNPMTTADAKVELVARAICWEANGKDRDCNTVCMAGNACLGPINECFLRDARAAITTLEASPNSRTEAIVPLSDSAIQAAEEAYDDFIRREGTRSPYLNTRAFRAAFDAALTAIQAARPIDQQEANPFTGPTLSEAELDEVEHAMTGVAPVQDDDAELIYALTKIARSMKYGPDQAWIEQAAERLERIANRLGNQSVGGEGRG